MKETILILAQSKGSYRHLHLSFGLMEGDEKIDIHRVALPPGIGIDKAMENVNSGIEKAGWPAVTDSIIAQVKDYAASIWTPEIIADYENHLNN